MLNEQINTYQNISGKNQTVYADWSNPTDVADDATINLYESIGDDLTDAGFFTLTASGVADAVSIRDLDEIDDVLDAMNTVDYIDNTMIDFGTGTTQVGGKDILWDGGDGHTYKILLDDGTLSVSQVS
jgi:hypothetical protein